MIKGIIDITSEEDGKRFAIHQNVYRPSINCVRAIRRNKEVKNLDCGKHNFIYDEKTDTLTVD